MVPYSAVSEGASPQAPPARTPSAASAFGTVLHGLGSELDRGEALAQRAIHGGGVHHSPEQLLALQAGIYRYSEAVDLLTKLVDRATQAVKTTLQNP
jgi:hypothetical protein